MNSVLASLPRYHGKRRVAQALSVLLAILVPATGLFRIDPGAGALVILDRQVWFADFFLIAGLWIMLLSALVMLYSMAGTVFCGWVCPQNIMAEWANHMTHKLLGKRAEVSLEGDAPVVAPAKNKALNWILLALAFLGAALFFGLIPLFYFYPPATVWAFVAWHADPKLAGSLHWIYAVFVLIIFIDIAVIRHFWCRFACVYRVWQHSFRTRQTLHVRYDATRSAECEKCNYCVTSCFIDIDPRKTDIYDSCINCGECIDACNRLHAKKQEPGLLRFEFGERKEKREARINFRNNAISLTSRSSWMAVIAALGLSLFAWGLWSWEPLHMSAYRAENQASRANLDYRIELVNKRYHPDSVVLSIRGLTDADYKLSETRVELPPAGRVSVILALSDQLPHGLHAFSVEASSPDGWHSHFPIQHFSEQRQRQ
ncbi:MAG: 4Fe-4S binding protein [Betaproteobacteria bacterium]|nr:4Fe-4S binding protein [Betaproteobacteria bacterium]MDE2131789.1 4Fe-4S binding protein [Betaproteobacteria bacterium]MDE2211362.1 4Fe-4S binding protein [Betaproteobacteria bacterium]